MSLKFKALPARVRGWWPSVLSAVLLLLAFPPFNLGLLVFVGLVPWLISLRNMTGKEAWRSGYGLGFVYGLGQLFWVAQLVSHWIGSLWIALLPYSVACALYAIYFGWAAVLIRHAWTRNWPWAIPLAWAGIEVFRSYLPVVAFPWGLIASPLWPYTGLIQTAHYGTIYMVSAWVMLANVLLALFFSGTEYRQVRTLIAGFAAIGAMSVMTLGASEPTQNVAMTVAQPGVDMAFGNPETVDADIFRNVSRIAATAASDGSKLLILPEGQLSAPTMPPVLPFDLPKGLPVLIGGRRGKEPIYQSAFTYDGLKWQYEDKTRLVLFGEFIPGRSLFPFIAQTFRLPSGDFSSGEHGVRSLDIAGLRSGPIICFEGLFPDISYRQAMNGAQFLAVMGIDDWFMDGNAPDQLRAGSIWRSVETGLPVVRSTPTGHTLATDGHGHVLGELPLRDSAGLRVDLPVPTRSPLFRGLPVFPFAAVSFALLMPWLRKRKPNAG